MSELPFEVEEWFPELDALQESGAINMFGAPRWLQENFGMNTIKIGKCFVASFFKRP